MDKTGGRTKIRRDKADGDICLANVCSKRRITEEKKLRWKIVVVEEEKEEIKHKITEEKAAEKNRQGVRQDEATKMYKFFGCEEEKL